jgi:hypothetical protein
MTILRRCKGCSTARSWLTSASWRERRRGPSTEADRNVCWYCGRRRAWSSHRHTCATVHVLTGIAGKKESAPPDPAPLAPTAEDEDEEEEEVLRRAASADDAAGADAEVAPAAEPLTPGRADAGTSSKVVLRASILSDRAL